jgi:hypothetical protein
MSPDAYRKRLASLDPSCSAPARAPASDGRQKARPCPSQSCCCSWAMIAKLDRVADKLAIKWRARWINLTRG